MANNKINDFRRSTAVTTSGPGAIVDARASRAPVSGVHAGLEFWDAEAPLVGDIANQKIFERRLLSKLNKKYFRLAPVVAKKQSQGMYRRASNHDPGISVAGPSLLLARFPNWLQCPECSVIKPANRWATEPGMAYRYCPGCSQASPGKQKKFVVPVRLVAACVNGHLDDFPWSWWVRHKASCDKNTSELKLYSKGTGLGGFHLKCTKCNAERSMESAFNRSALSGLSCEGRRPWLESDDIGCTSSGENGEYRALQRGASNLYYPIFESALDIPPWTEQIQSLINDWWDNLADISDPQQRTTWIKMTRSLMDAITQAGYTAEEVSKIFEQMRKEASLAAKEDLRLDEYRVFNSRVATRHQEFEAYPSEITGSNVVFLETLTRVPRLREVRVLKGFTRIRPPQDNQLQDYAPLSETPKDWLPAIEIRGEGIFVSLSQERLTVWESRPNVISKCRLIEEEYQQDFAHRYPDENYVPKLSPRRLLLHSLSHALIRQLTLECGYSSASLRERIYVDDNANTMAGILIYTGTTDSDGTLGGLQARGNENLFHDTLQIAVKASQWCSSDPICIEGKMSSREMHSGASCHSCLLVSETSCEAFNKYLDRSLLVGTPEDSTIGYFNNN